MAQPASTLPTISPWQRLAYFLRLGRPLHLVGGFVFNGLGMAIALYLGSSINWWAAAIVQVVITATQLMTHYSNDYFDQDADAATTTPTRWSSGSRVLPDGLIPPRVALLTALVCGGVALAGTAVLLITRWANLATVGLSVLSIGLAWSYSSPPLWLNRRGLGEVTGSLLVPGLTTLLGFMVQTGGFSWLPVLSAVPLVFFQMAMLLSVNFPDVAGDALVNKRTLVVAWGPRRAATLFAAALIAAYASLPLLVWAGLPALVALAVALTSPIALWQLWRIARGAATDPAQWSALAFWSIGLLLSAAMLELAAYVTLALASG
jgi:1,4-dihydroxy-2-naphthoate octaprenyltransferase